MQHVPDFGGHVCKVGDRWAVLDRLSSEGVGSLDKGVAIGLKLRVDNSSDYSLQRLAYWKVKSRLGFIRQPETNEVAERFHRTLNKQIVAGRVVTK